MINTLPADIAKHCESTLRRYFPKLSLTDQNITQAAPLLVVIIPERDIAATLINYFQLAIDPSLLIANLNPICDQFNQMGLLQEGQLVNPFYYRLPIVMGEFPRHTRTINFSIQAFNQFIEAYHQNQSQPINAQELNQAFCAIIHALKTHGSYCCPESMSLLVMMLRGWSAISPQLSDQPQHTSGLALHNNIVSAERQSIAAAIDFKMSTASLSDHLPQDHPRGQEPPMRKLISSITKTTLGSLYCANNHGMKHTFMQHNSYPINKAGLIAAKSHKLLVNAFGLKFGGHFDAIATYSPSFIPVLDFYYGFCRELSLRLDLSHHQATQAEMFKVALINTLNALGVVVETKNPASELSARYINPFCHRPQAWNTPSLIKQALKKQIDQEKVTLTLDEIEIISDQLNQTLMRMQFNPSLALGIGANDDGTVSFSNDGGSYAFEFGLEHATWAARFEQLSLHRQGPAQAKMNASKGVLFELNAAFFTEFARMSQLQPAEQLKTIYNALIDNLVTDLFPHPDYCYNQHYEKFSKRYIVIRSKEGISQLQSYVIKSQTGIFQANGKLVPRHRRAGTIDVQPLARDHDSGSQSFRNSYQANPLAALQFQHARLLLGGVRGDLAYNPVGPDSFIQDHANGQIIQYDDGSYVPLIGLIPKNFDKHFKQDNELCASFVIRMLHSAKMMTDCPTLHNSIARIKVNFLPNAGEIPGLIPCLQSSEYLVIKHQALIDSLKEETSACDFTACEAALFSLIRNIIYELRPLGLRDERFLNYHYHLISSPEFLRTVNREQVEKVLRGLTINPPQDNANSHQLFNNVMDYLQQLTNSFYPNPSDEVAKKITAQAQSYLPLLVDHPSIQSYFTTMQTVKDVNLSRRQSPGMLYAALKHGRANLSRLADLNKMHTDNFISGYRNVEGGLITEPLPVDYRLDRAIKSVAIFSALLQHDDNPLKQLYTPFIRAYDYGNGYLLKNRYREEILPSKIFFTGAYASLGLIAGSVEGGLKLAACPLKIVSINVLSLMMNQLGVVVRQQPSITNTNPLFFAAAPTNEPGFKVVIAKEILDTLLAATKTNNRSLLIEQLRALIINILNKTFPSLTSQMLLDLAGEIITATSLSEQQWQHFYTPFVNNPPDLSLCLERHQEVLNTDFIAIAYRCFLLSLIDKPKAVILEMKKVYHLNQQQLDALPDFMQLLKQANNQAQLISLFAADGQLAHQIKQRFQVVDLLYYAALQAFDSDKIEHFLFALGEKSYHDKILNPEYALPCSEAHHVISTMPYPIRNEFARFYQTIQRGEKMIDQNKEEIKTTDDLELINILENEIHSLRLGIDQYKAENSSYFNALLHALYQMPVTQKTLLLASDALNTVLTTSQELLSSKDQAQRRWSDFVMQQKQHQFLNVNQIKELFNCLAQSNCFAASASLTDDFNEFKTASTDLDSNSNQSITQFYRAWKKIHAGILLPAENSKFPPNLVCIMDNFFHVTMNTVLNRCLDQIDYDRLRNPLLQYDEIGLWLLDVYQHKEDFRSLLAQQAEQPYLDQTIVRQIFIINCLERKIPLFLSAQEWQMNKKNEVSKDLIIRKTGLQRLLRSYSQQNNALKNVGSIDSSLRLSLKPLYNKDYPTFFYAMQRVEQKLSMQSSNRPVI